MKKALTLLLALACVQAFGGCGPAKAAPQRPAAALIGEDAASVTVSHTARGQTTEWVVSGPDLEELRAWAAGLAGEPREFEAGRTPGDTEGGAAYDFVPAEGGRPGFSYLVNGPEDCYLTLEGRWYFVRNPSAPPVAPPETAD